MAQPHARPKRRYCKTYLGTGLAASGIGIVGIIAWLLDGRSLATDLTLDACLLLVGWAFGYRHHRDHREGCGG